MSKFSIFSNQLINLLQNYDKEHTLSNIERMMLYQQLLDITNNEPELKTLNGDIVEGLKNYYNELYSSNKFDVIYMFKHTFKQWINIPLPTLYYNSENVHAFSSSAVQMANILLQKYSSVYFIPKEFTNTAVYEFLKTIEDAPPIHGIYLTSLFASIWKYINSSQYKQELVKRLYDELLDCQDVCLSGKFIRLVNVVNGFDNFEVSPGKKEYNKSYIFHQLNKKINVLEIENFTSQVEKIINKIDLNNINTEDVLYSLKMYTKVNWEFNNQMYTPYY